MAIDTKKLRELAQRSDYELRFTAAVTEIVMRHVDRMGDICTEDPAERIIQSFTRQFDTLFSAYLKEKFPNGFGGPKSAEPTFYIDRPTVLALLDEIDALRELLDTRPALNTALIEAYHAWTAKVYAQSIGAKLPGETLQ